MFHKNGKETAIKLINKYADEYHVLEIENKNLKRINKDLKANIKINKEIINSFFKPLPFDEKTKELITSIQHENMFLSKLNKSSNQIITELNIKINELNRKLQTNISMYTEENEKLQTEIFNLKNIIILKDNKITSLKHKEKNHSNNSSTINITNCKIDTLCNFDIKEVYITNPTPVINSLNDEVISLKELLNKLNKHIAILKAKLKRYEKGIQMHEKEIAQYKVYGNVGEAFTIAEVALKGYQTLSSDGDVTGTYVLGESGNVSFVCKEVPKTGIEIVTSWNFIAGATILLLVGIWSLFPDKKKFATK
jgi:LPXTG-motif cell wall-anchored protein